MATQLGELTLEEAAQQAAGNWKSFDCFVWFRSDLEDADDWCVVYNQHRDSGLIDESNAHVIQRELAKFAESDDPDVVPERHDHYLVGWIEGFSIRVFKNGDITPAFARYFDLQNALEDYPILDQDDYSTREYEATVENIAACAWRLKHDYDLPEDWQQAVYSWLSDNECSEMENTDDQGGYPSEEALQAAFTALGYDSAEAVTV
jgi:hypothetical protein